MEKVPDENLADENKTILTLQSHKTKKRRPNNCGFEEAAIVSL